QPTGCRALLHAPHAVPTRDEDAVVQYWSDQRTPVGTQWARPNPYLVALRPANPVEELAGRIDNGVDDGSRHGSLGTTQLHHAGDPQLALQRRARHPHIRQIDRTENRTLHRHREGVTAAGLHRNPNPAPDWFRQPPAG